MGLEERRQERDIEGVIYEVTPLPFGIGRKMLMRLVKIAGPVLGAAASKDGSKTIAAIADAMSDDDVAAFADAFGKSSKYKDGDKWVPLVEQNRELHFAGRYLEFLRWLMFCAEVNYAPFFNGLMKGNAGGVSALKIPSL